MARRTFACGHQGKGQYCHRCQQEAQTATREAQEKAREREQREAWKDSFAADPIARAVLPIIGDEDFSD